MIASGLSDLAKLSRENGQKLMLKEFICGRNRLEVPGTQALAAVFEELGTLEIIELPQNGIQPEGMRIQPIHQVALLGSRHLII